MTTGIVDTLSMFVTNLSIFVMGKENVNQISVWEKIADFMMDISKYVLTAVIITSALEELSEVGWMMYVVGIAGALLLFLFSIFILNFINEKQ